MTEQDYAARVRDIRAALTYAVAFEHGRANHAQDPNTCDVPLCATERMLSEALAILAAPAPSEPGLDTAWAEAEAALPDGWWVHALYAWSFGDMAWRAEAATAGSHFWAGKSKREKVAGTVTYAPGPMEAAYGDTPAAALRALAARLRGGQESHHIPSGDPSAPRT